MPPRVLMCPPDHYGIEYEINPWMNRSLGAVREIAFAQWRALRDTLVSLGAAVEALAPRPGLPDLVFTANAGLVFGSRFLSSRFRHEVRAKESPVFDAWFAAHGFTVEHLPDGMYHEGAGDALFCGDTLFAGYRTRSAAARAVTSCPIRSIPTLRPSRRRSTFWRSCTGSAITGPSCRR